MTVYSFSQLQELWKQNGGDPTFAPMAAAVAMAESGGRSDAVSPMNSNGTHDYGIWQISLKGGDGGMLDPNANAKRAIQMSNNGKTWHPWCTAYSDGACGMKGGTYLGSSAPFWKFLKGTGATVPSGPAFNGGNTVPAPGSGGTITKTSSDNNPCLIPLPSLGPVGGGCLLRQSQARALIGGGIVAAGVMVGLVGAALLANKLTGMSLPKTALMAAAPEAAPAIAAESMAEKRSRMKAGTKTYDADGTEISAREANRSPSKRQAYREQEARKHPATTQTLSDGSTF